MKVTQKLEQERLAHPGKPTLSFEYFVPKTVQGVHNLYDRMDRMFKLSPQFIDVTWNAGGVGSNLTAELVHTAQHVIGVDTVMHLTCAGMSLEVVDAALDGAYNSGCHNILALRGDLPHVPPGQSPPASAFSSAKELVLHIKQRFGDHFDIGVAAYPEGHPEEMDPDVLIGYLKEKVDAGASFVVTQMVYDADLFIEWVKKCRKAGIDVPIIPGIMPISGWASFLRRAKWCQVRIPPAFLEKLGEHSNDDAEVRRVGSQLVAEMCNKLIENGITHLHFYTMNLEQATRLVLEQVQGLSLTSDTKGQLPWRPSRGAGRTEESVRPIFWNKRRHSYVSRTATWDEFPNGRWGHSSSPAFGELERYGVLLRQSASKARELWGSPETLEDLTKLVTNYIKGNVACLPWSDDPIQAEVKLIETELLALNTAGFLTINSQPALNGVSSSDPVHGWGPPLGYVYQKAYLELLVPKERYMSLRPKLESDPQVTYYAVCTGCDSLESNAPPEANAVTWGIFPGREVQQPTIVEKVSFLAWKDEAFRLAREWSECFENNSPSKRLLGEIADNWYLVNIVHNDYHDPKAIFRIFFETNGETVKA